MQTNDVYFNSITILLGVLALISALFSFLLNLSELSEGKTPETKARIKRNRIKLIYIAFALSVLTLMFQSKNDFNKNIAEIQKEKKQDSTRQSNFDSTLFAIKHTIDSIDTVLLRQKKQMLDLTMLSLAQRNQLRRLENLRVTIDAARTISITGMVKLDQERDLDSILQLFTHDLSFMNESEKFSFRNISGDDGISSTTYLKEKARHFTDDVRRRIAPQIKVYILPRNTNLNRILKDTTGWALSGWGYENRFEKSAETFIPFSWVIEGKIDAEKSYIDYSTYSRYGDETTKDVKISVFAEANIQPTSKALAFSDLQNHMAVVQLSSNSYGWDLPYLKIINEDTKAFLDVDIIRQIANRKKKFTPGFGWGYCVETFYIGKIGELVVNVRQ